MKWTRGSKAAARLVCAAPMLLLFFIPGGCAASVTPAAHDRGSGHLAIEVLSEDAWPERFPEALQKLLEADVNAVEVGESPFEFEQLQPGMLQVFRVMTQEMPERSQRVYGMGLVHALNESDDGSLHLMYVTNRLPPDQFDSLTKSDALLEDRRGENVQRWRLVLRRALTEDQRGLVVHLPSIGNRRYENAVNDSFRRRGWSVLSVIPPTLTIRVVESGPEVSPPVVTTGQSLAERLDEFAADYAYAVEGTVAYLRAWHPDLDTKPIVVVGYSAGSLAASTVAARLGEQVGAAIFIGGGANVAGILLESTAAQLGVRLRLRHGASVEADLAELPDAYLKASRFDPYCTAPALSELPVLVIDGLFDHIIPRPYRELLYERLDRPERWTYPVGHVLLFWILPSQAEAIATWLDEAVERVQNGTS